MVFDLEGAIKVKNKVHMSQKCGGQALISFGLETGLISKTHIRHLKDSWVKTL